MLKQKWIFAIAFTFFYGNSTAEIHAFLRAIGTSINTGLTQKLLTHIEDEPGNFLEKLRMKVYTGRRIDVATIIDIPITEWGIIYSQIDHTKPLVIHVHGFREHPANESIRTVVGAYLERGTDNICLLDWSALAFDNYLVVRNRVKNIAKVLTETFDVLVDLGLNLETFHLVGHSLGAQIGGFFGRYSKYSIPRITGLDPAKPGFYHDGAEHIDAESARFVDIIHTDGGAYGALTDTGTVDFYPNGGSRAQPGCPFLGIPLTPSDLCSHWRSWRYYAETVENNLAFPATQCSSYSDYRSGKCSANRRVYYGYAVPNNVRGRYYFTTNSNIPFGNNVA